MRRLTLPAAALCVALAGCGSPLSPTTQSGLGQALPEHNVTKPARSWMLAGAKQGSLLYVSSLWTSAVYVLSYPKLGLVGVLAGSDFDQPVGLCSDDNGDVFVPLIGENETLEYAHGGSRPIATLSSSPATAPYTCAADPTTGNLAVDVDMSDSQYAAIYANASGTPSLYENSYINNPTFYGYDNKGDLFADGYNKSMSGAVLTELPKGGKAFTNLQLSEGMRGPGSVQWDGKHMTMYDEAAGVLYRLKITASGAQVVGSTTLSPYGNGIYSTWIDRDRIVGADDARAFVGVWKYPQGGTVLKTVTVEEPFSVTISTPPQK